MSKHGPPRRGAEEGSVAVEAAFIVPLLLLVLIGGVEFGRAFWTYHRMLLAVEEAGRYAMVYAASPSLLTAASCPGVSGSVTLSNCAVAKANAYLAAYGTTGVTVTPSEDTSSPKNLTITATRSFNFIAPNLLPFGPINLSTQVKVPEI